MYKVFTSLWSKSSTSTNHKTQLSTNNSFDSSSVDDDDDDWVFVSKTVSNDKTNSMTNSWITMPPVMRTDQSPSINRSSSPNTHHFNPIENLLIEHASMSVYEQIASRTRAKRHKKTVNDGKLDEEINNDEDDDDDRASVVLQYQSQHPNLTSIHHRNLNVSLNHSINSSVSTLESSTSSLVAHHRHLHRIHQRRRRSTKTSTKLPITNNDEQKQTFNKILERQRLNFVRTPKYFLHQPAARSNH